MWGEKGRLLEILPWTLKKRCVDIQGGERRKKKDLLSGKGTKDEEDYTLERGSISIFEGKGFLRQACRKRSGAWDIRKKTYPLSEGEY